MALEKMQLKYSVTDIQIPALMLEITTGIGCRVNCKFCPQKTFLKAYKSSKLQLSLDDFKHAINKIPDDVIIIFSGFAEPYLNKDCSKMILYAAEKGHPISLFTTGIGLTLEDVALIKGIPYCKTPEFPQGGFILHLADDEDCTDIQVDDEYLQILKAIKKAGIQNLALRSMGKVHKKIEPIFPVDRVKILKMNSRAGNLDNEGIEATCNSCFHKGKVICGREEYLYNNVMLPNGDIVLCCQDFGLRHILGNILEEPYEKILPDFMASYKLCQSCHNAVRLPGNFPLFNVIRKYKK